MTIGRSGSHPSRACLPDASPQQRPVWHHRRQTEDFNREWYNHHAVS